MSLVIPGLGKTIMPKRRRPSPKTKIMPRGKVTANPCVTDKKPRPKLGSKPSGKKYDVRPGMRPSRPSPIKASSGKKYEGPMRPGMRPSRPSRIKASSKRGGARPMSSPPRRPSGRR